MPAKRVDSGQDVSVMSERPYLSIGEVLELLKGDFPDLSISRIRALESAGQLDLERTASGYRKFYDGDIAYLRSLLNGTATSTSRRMSPPAEARLNLPDDSHDDADEPPELGPNGELPGDPERRHPAAFQSLRRELASRPTVVPSAGSGSTSSPRVPAQDHTAEVVTPTAPVTPQLTVVASGRTEQSPAQDAVSTPTSTPTSTPVDPTPEAEPMLGSRNPLATDASGVSLSLDELVAATGLTIELIRELESLGLLKGKTVFSAVYYDEDALLTCKLVAAFGSYGVEPRHLRMYKLAADREASFFEQVVTPQLRRRNPDARQSAIDTLGELVKLGEQLRVVALRQVLKSSINK